MGQTAVVFSLVPCPLQVTSPRVVAGDRVEGAALSWVWQGMGGGGLSARCVFGVCHATLGHLMLLSPPTPPCFTSFIMCQTVRLLPVVVVFGGWRFQGPRWKHCRHFGSCVTHSVGAPGRFCPPMSHREPGKELLPFLLSPNTSGPPPSLPPPRVGMCPPGYLRAPAWPGSGLLATCERNDYEWGWGNSGYHIPLPWQSLGAHTGELSPHPLTHPF